MSVRHDPRELAEEREDRAGLPVTEDDQAVTVEPGSDVDAASPRADLLPGEVRHLPDPFDCLEVTGAQRFGSGQQLPMPWA